MTGFPEASKPRHRIVVCRGEYCNLDRRADKLLARLNAAVDEANDGAEPPCASVRTANCLSMCAIGPNLVVYPEDAVYNRASAPEINEIIEKFIRNSGT